MILQPKVRRFIRDIAEETGLSFNQVRDIAMGSQFSFLLNSMSEGIRGEPDTFKNIIIRFLGTFKASPGKIQHMSKMAKIKKENEDEESNGII